MKFHGVCILKFMPGTWRLLVFKDNPMRSRQFKIPSPFLIDHNNQVSIGSSPQRCMWWSWLWQKRRLRFLFIPHSILNMHLILLIAHTHFCFLFFITFLLFYYSYVHTRLESFLLPAPPLPHTPPPPSSSHPSIPSRNYFALISNFVEERV
jgi:hypothetical protein